MPVSPFWPEDHRNETYLIQNRTVVPLSKRFVQPLFHRVCDPAPMVADEGVDLTAEEECHRCLPNDIAVQRRTREGAKRPTRPSVCNGRLDGSVHNPCAG